jgi:hypothetical protein
LSYNIAGFPLWQAPNPTGGGTTIAAINQLTYIDLHADLQLELANWRLSPQINIKQFWYLSGGVKELEWPAADVDRHFPTSFDLRRPLPSHNLTLQRPSTTYHLIFEGFNGCGKEKDVPQLGIHGVRQEGHAVGQLQTHHHLRLLLQKIRWQHLSRRKKPLAVSRLRH